jgi:hypothetical protein
MIMLYEKERYFSQPKS